MGKNSAIEWTDHTVNPWQGCHKVSDGCANCYMYRDKNRYGQDPTKVVRSSNKTFFQTLAWKELARVFVCSWSDFFIEEADGWREEFWQVIRQTPHLTYQILTKRPQNIADRLPTAWGNGWPNVWLGVTAENQQAADERIPILLQTPAAVRFVSCEPMLGPMDLNYEFNQWLGEERTIDCGGCSATPVRGQPYCPGHDAGGIDWVICGGESGPGARPMHPDWVRGLRDQCRAARTRFLFKQWGEWAAINQPWKQSEDVQRLENNERWLNLAGGYGFHGEEVWRMRRVGKKAAGNLLDGRTWEEYPGEGQP